jgi:hypothetical protein
MLDYHLPGFFFHKGTHRMNDTATIDLSVEDGRVKVLITNTDGQKIHLKLSEDEAADFYRALGTMLS